MQLTNIDELIGREAALASQLIGAGLTSMRKYDFAFKGVFYSGMFSTTIGFERLLKLILLLKYKADNKNFPGDEFLRKSGHNINKLINQCMSENSDQIKAIKQDERLSEYSKVLEDDLIQNIASFMTDFANSTRYYNLDVITGGSAGTNEPLAEWDRKICSVIVERHPPSEKRISKCRDMANMMRSHTSIYHTHESGEHIGGIDKFMYSSMLVKKKQSYSTYYIYRLIYFFVRLLIELDFKLNPQLFLREYFENLHMANHSSSAIRRRKIWV